MKFFQWVAGRQNSGYETMKLAESKLIGFDLWLLRYKPGAYIKSHVDRVIGKRHYRLNIFLKQAKSGGNFRHGEVIFKNKFMVFFRPDISYHSVMEVEEGTRYVLSLGFVLKEKQCKN